MSAIYSSHPTRAKITVLICSILKYFNFCAHCSSMPARAPFRVNRKLHVCCLNKNLLMKRTMIPPVEAPRIVLTIANATTSPSPTFEIDPCKQTLNNYVNFNKSYKIREVFNCQVCIIRRNSGPFSDIK